MFAGRFAHQFFELDPEIWYGHSLGYNKKDISFLPLTREKKKTLGDREDRFLLYPKECPYQISGSNSKN